MKTKVEIIERFLGACPRQMVGELKAPTFRCKMRYGADIYADSDECHALSIKAKRGLGINDRHICVLTFRLPKHGDIVCSKDGE
jgi:hypothetical protein